MWCCGSIPGLVGDGPEAGYSGDQVSGDRFLVEARDLTLSRLTDWTAIALMPNVVPNERYCPARPGWTLQRRQRSSGLSVTQSAQRSVETCLILWANGKGEGLRDGELAIRAAGDVFREGIEFIGE